MEEPKVTYREGLSEEQRQAKITPTTANQLLGTAIPITQQLPQFALIQQPRDPLRPKKVAILGTAPSSRMMAPFADPEWTIWGSSPGNMGILPRVDAWFEMHCNLLWPEYKSYGEPYVRWLNEQPFPIIAQDSKVFPKAIPYPIHRMVRKFGRYFFTSTFAYMMAYAIDVGVEAMALYGVDMSSKDEYALQRPGGHHFILVAREHNIEVIIPSESDLEQPPPLYGYVDGTPLGRKMAARDVEVGGRINQLEQEVNRLQQQLTYLRGAREDVDYMRTVWAGVADITGDEEELEHLRVKVAELEREQQYFAQLKQEINELRALHKEASEAASAMMLGRGKRKNGGAVREL